MKGNRWTRIVHINKKVVDFPHIFELEPGDRIPADNRRLGTWFPKTREDGTAIAVLCFKTEEEMLSVSDYIRRKRADDVREAKE